jgi:drug/metabolite transporter (DMT)-like permease
VPPNQRPFFALFLRLIGSVAVATMFMLVKLAASSGVALPEIMFWRQAVTVPMLVGYLLATGGIDRLRTRRLGSHAGRAAMGTTGMVANFGGVILLPLAVATTLNFTAPLFAVIVTALALRQRVGKWRWLAVMFGFAGVLVIAQPGHHAIPLLGGAAALTAALLNVLISFQIRNLGRTEEPITVVFYFGLFGALIAAGFLPFFATAHSAYQWVILIALGVVGTVGQLFMTAALRYGEVASVIVMDYSQLLWATLYGWLIWQQFPTLGTWLGTPLIVAAGLVIAWREHLHSHVVSAAAIMPD